MKNLLKYLFTGSLLFAVYSCNDDDDPRPEPAEPNLVEAANAAGLTTLLSAVEAVPGLGSTLVGAPAITVFAPDNAAFTAALTAFGATDLNDLVAKLGGAQNLETVLGFHVVPAVAFSTDLAATNTFTTLAGQDLTVNSSGGAVTVVDAAGNTANVTTANVEIENGVVHVINRVLIPEIDLPTPNLVEAATDAGLTTLLAAVTAVDGLADALLDAEAITVFAPRNEAFATLLEDQEVNTLEALIAKLGAENVSKVLTFHVVPATAFSFDLEEGPQSVPTLAGEDLTVTRSGDNVTVTDTAGNTFNVVTADVAIQNGVVHVIDGVVLPTLE